LCYRITDIKLRECGFVGASLLAKNVNDDSSAQNVPITLGFFHTFAVL
jgi:hypothetical protein